MPTKLWSSRDDTNASRRPSGDQVGDSLEPNFVHRFTRDEIASELAEGGFELKSFGVTPYGHALARAKSLDRTPRHAATR